MHRFFIFEDVYPEEYAAAKNVLDDQLLSKCTSDNAQIYIQYECTFNEEALNS